MVRAGLIPTDMAEAQIEVMEHARDQWELERAWADKLRANALGEEARAAPEQSDLVAALDLLRAVIQDDPALPVVEKSEHLAAVDELKRQVIRRKPVRVGGQGHPGGVGRDADGAGGAGALCTGAGALCTGAGTGGQARVKELLVQPSNGIFTPCTA